MRERHARVDLSNHKRGITPAYAGKTLFCRLVELLSQDHPRVCGKDLSHAKQLATVIGSPPRMRERPIILNCAIYIPRITPAYAGKTCFSPLRRNSYWDHPRVCGKDCKLTTMWAAVIGSPPRMRERRTFFEAQEGSDGITPAYAGKTKSIERRVYRTRDHPRVCGKDKTLLWKQKVPLGSPPRMRERPHA